MTIYKIGYEGPEPRVYTKKQISISEENNRFYVNFFQMVRGKRESKSFEVKRQDLPELRSLEGKVAILFDGLDPVGVRPLRVRPQEDPRPSTYTIKGLHYKGQPVVVTEGFRREYQKIHEFSVDKEESDVYDKVDLALKQPDIKHKLGTAKSIPGYLLIFQSNLLTHILEDGKNALLDHPKRYTKSSAFLVKYL